MTADLARRSRRELKVIYGGPMPCRNRPLEPVAEADREAKRVPEMG